MIIKCNAKSSYLLILYPTSVKHHNIKYFIGDMTVICCFKTSLKSVSGFATCIPVPSIKRANLSSTLAPEIKYPTENNLPHHGSQFTDKSRAHFVF